MGRKRQPLCASCGEPLDKGNGTYLVVTYEDEPGRPSMGWHIDCAQEDEVSPYNVGSSFGHDDDRMAIALRGEGRITFTSARAEQSFAARVDRRR